MAVVIDWDLTEPPQRIDQVAAFRPGQVPTAAEINEYINLLISQGNYNTGWLTMVAEKLTDTLVPDINTQLRQITINTEGVPGLRYTLPVEVGGDTLLEAYDASDDSWVTIKTGGAAVSNIAIFVDRDNWVLTADGDYTNTILVDGMLDICFPDWALLPANMKTYSEAERAARRLLRNLETYDGGIILHATAAPVNSFTILVKDDAASGSDVIANYTEMIGEISALETEVNTVNTSLTAPTVGMFIYDYQNGSHGFNTSPTRGADTFIPFSKGGLIPYLAWNEKTWDSGESSISATSEHADRHVECLRGAYRDLSTPSFWGASSSTVPQAITVTFKTAKTVSKIELVAVNQENFVPSDMVFYGSNDGTTWTTLIPSMTMPAVMGLQKEFEVSQNKGSYKYYKLTITKVAGGHDARLAVMQLY